jgi:hypothetical protein
MQLDNRVRRLETSLLSDPIVLVFANGSTREIRYQGLAMLGLFMAALSGEGVSPQMRQHLDWIRDCVEFRDSGGGHMIEVIKQAMQANSDDVCRTPAPCLRPPQFGPLPDQANRGAAVTILPGR